MYYISSLINLNILKLLNIYETTNLNMFIYSKILANY